MKFNINTIKTALKLLRSRPLFKNYYSSILMYVLSRLGLAREQAIVLRCSESSEARMSLYTFGKLLHLHINNMVRGVDCLNKAFRSVDGFLVPIDELTFGSAINVAMANGWRYDFDKKYWFKDGVKFKHMHGPIIETFDLNQYDFVDVDGKVVLDVGAFVGDTPIYFVLKGAKLVYAVEPLPANYEEMLQNIALNGLSDRIVAIKSAIGYGRAEVRIPYSTGAYLRGSSIYEMMERPHGGYEFVNVASLNNLYNSLPVKPTVLKMDCEGCEFDIIFNDYETVRLFNEIAFEYHSYITGYSVHELIKILSKDFKCYFVKELFYRMFYSSYSRDELGMVHCVKRT